MTTIEMTSTAITIDAKPLTAALAATKRIVRVRRYVPDFVVTRLSVDEDSGGLTLTTRTAHETFSINVPAVVMIGSSAVDVDFRELQKACAKLVGTVTIDRQGESDTMTVTSSDENGNPRTAVLAASPAADWTPWVPDTVGEVALGKTGLIDLAAAAVSASGDGTLPMLCGVMLWQRPGQITTVGTDRFRLTVASVGTDDPHGREGNPDAPVLIPATVFASLSKLKGTGTARIALAAADPSGGEYVSVGSYRITTDEWEYAAVAQGLEFPRFKQIISRSEDAGVAKTVDGTVVIDAGEMRAAIRSLKLEKDETIALRWTTTVHGVPALAMTPCTPDQDQNRTTGPTLAMVEAIDIHEGGSTTGDGPYVFDPKLLSQILGAIGTGRKTTLQWGPSAQSTVKFVYLEDDTSRSIQLGIWVNWDS